MPDSADVLPFSAILGAEFDALGVTASDGAGGQRTMRQPATDGPHTWSVTAGDIADLEEFARRLGRSLPGLRLDERATRQLAGAHTVTEVSESDAAADYVNAVVGESLPENGQPRARAQSTSMASTADIVATPPARGTAPAVSTGPAYATTDAAKQAVASALNGILDKSWDDAPFIAELSADPVIAELREGVRRGGADAKNRQRQLNRLLLERVFEGALRTVEDKRLQGLYAEARSRPPLAALCLSGGGIRSATFSLGIVQGLARIGVLGKFDYLSTVSGGGYLGSWLSAWMARTSAGHVIEELAGGHPSAENPEPAAVQYLRAYTNYLSPRSGALSVDTWTLVATYVRNVLLNWLLLLPVLALAALVPRGFAAVLQVNSPQPNDIVRTLLIVGAAGVALAVASVTFAHTFRPAPASASTASKRAHRKELSHKAGDQATFLWHCLVPMLLAAGVLSVEWYWVTHWVGVGDQWATTWYGRPFVALPRWAVFAILGSLVHLVGFTLSSRPKREMRGRVLEAMVVVGTGGAAGVVASFAAGGLARLQPFGYAVLAVPTFMGVMLAGQWLFVGLVSRSGTADDASREWSARFSAWLLIVIVSWISVSALVLFAAEFTSIVTHVRWAGVVSLLSGAITAWLGWRPATGPAAGKSPASESPAIQQFSGAALGLAATVFACTVIPLLSMVDAGLITGACSLWSGFACHAPFTVMDGPLYALGYGSWRAVLAVGGLLALILAVSACVIDPNKFSLHAMYRARLMRAYLGASRLWAEREPNSFTKFDDHDNLHMYSLWPAGQTPRPPDPHPPLQLLNLTLNLVKGEKLAWQERQAESFTVSALHAGSKELGYRATSYGAGVVTPVDDSVTKGHLYGGDGGISLGTAMTISGAAVSPNMGYHSSPAIAFIMTLFNARLGWWLGNPGPKGAKTFASPSLNRPLRAILSELFGLANDRSQYVYLSDGGHFENLGLYEMVARRCRHIVVVDAGEDPECTFADLGNAIRKIRIDQGIPIEFANSIEIYPRADTGNATLGRYAAAATVRYSCIDKQDPGKPDADYDGTLVYLKPALYGTEPRDVYEYGQRNAAFPHDTTLNQMFDESQFESYRALGSHIIEVIASAQGVKAPRGSLEWFEQCARLYTPISKPRSTNAPVTLPMDGVVLPAGAGLKLSPL